MKYIETLENCPFEIGDAVYLKSDPDQNERIVTGINIRESGLMYVLSFIDQESWHYGFEIIKDRDIIKATSG